MKMKFKILAFLLGISSYSACNAEKLESVTLNDLRYMSAWNAKHENIPMNVPSSYDWARKTRMGAGSMVPVTPEGIPFKSFVGWGQVFSIFGSTSHPAPIAMKNYMVLMCHGPNHVWSRIQYGDITGGQYVADFSSNAAVAPKAFYKADNETTVVDFDLGKSYHFWAKSGRSLIPNDGICGVAVLAQAKNFTPIATPVYLLGYSADYWLDQTAQWVSTYANNKDLGIGRLGVVTNDWKWFGMIVSTDLEVKNLYENGYSLQ